MLATAPAINNEAENRTADGVYGLRPLMLDLRPIIDMTDDQFFLLCAVNHPLRFERTATGEIVVMAPEGGSSGSRNLTIGSALWFWARQDGRGVAFGSSAGFKLPNGATYAPDAAWVHKERLATLSDMDKDRFLPLCPDFVIELRSRTDRLHDLQDKMVEYIANGCQLGWLLDPYEHNVFVYRPGDPPENLQNPDFVAGDPTLPGFVLALADIWDPGF